MRRVFARSPAALVGRFPHRTGPHHRRADHACGGRPPEPGADPRRAAVAGVSERDCRSGDHGPDPQRPRFSRFPVSSSPRCPLRKGRQLARRTDRHRRGKIAAGVPPSTRTLGRFPPATCATPSFCETLTSFPYYMRVRILYHDHCFDGAASAAFFSRMAEDKFYPGAEFCFTGMAHKASQLFEPELFDGDVNAIVDFKYSPDPRLTWWFDHHQSAFLSPEDAAHFRQDTSGKKMFDVSFRSCTNYIATVAREKFDYDPADLHDLVHWADIIDGALYKDPE